jgi:hypothetical protein
MPLEPTKHVNGRMWQPGQGHPSEVLQRPLGVALRWLRQTGWQLARSPCRHRTGGQTALWAQRTDVWIRRLRDLTTRLI